MKQFTYVIQDPLGIHARPAGLLVKLAKQYTSAITIEKNGKTCDMRKLMAVMGIKENFSDAFGKQRLAENQLFVGRSGHYLQYS